MFKDKNGNISSKRIIGAIVVASALLFTAFGIGDPVLVQTMFYTGMGALAITVAERKS